jgi:hypothetical protein
VGQEGGMDLMDVNNMAACKKYLMHAGSMNVASGLKQLFQVKKWQS